MDAWVTEIHVYSGYLAGVYANPGPINSDISNINVARADAIWITKENNPPQVTIWNQGIDDTLWPDTQRMHQFLIDQTGVTWGGVTFSPSVDDDIDNAPIANANNGAKTYSYAYTTIDYPGATETYPAGINDISGTALINTAGQTGAIVGYYKDSSLNVHGFQYANGTFSSIDYPGAAATFAQGINNTGQIVGGWCPATGNCQGFRRSATGTFSNLRYPGSASTQANGINDAGQVVGQYYNSTGNDHGFLLYAGNSYTIDAPGASGTLANAINGDASIAGTFYSPDTSFVEYALPPTWSGTFTTFSYGGGPTYGNGIDNDNDLLGEASGGGFLLTNNVLITTFQYPGALSTETLGVNDFGQIVGWYVDSSGNQHGFLTAPQ